MRKGKLGITYIFYATVAFALALFGQVLLGGLLLALVLIVEKDEWTSRQCMQAFFLSFIASIGSTISSLLATIRSPFVSINILYFGLSAISSLVVFIIDVAVIIFAIMGLLNVMKGNEANVPFVSAFSYKAFGYVQQVTVQPQQVPMQQQAPMAPQQPQQAPVMQQQQPMQQPMQQAPQEYPPQNQPPAQ